MKAHHPAGGPFRLANRLFAGLFLLCVALQWNDPDPLQWMAIYAAAAAACLGHSHPKWAWFELLVLLLALSWAAVLFPETEGVRLGELPRTMETRGGAVELGREVGGLSWIVLWMGVLLLNGRKGSDEGLMSRPGVEEPAPGPSPPRLTWWLDSGHRGGACAGAVALCTGACLMKRSLLVLVLLSLAGCSEGAWQPVITPSPGMESGIDAAAFSDGCSVAWESLLLGIAGGALLGPEDENLADLPGDQAFELLGTAGTALAQVHLSTQAEPSALRLDLGPPGATPSGNYEGPCPHGDCGVDGLGEPRNPRYGTATEAQRDVLVGGGLGGQVQGSLQCGAEPPLQFSLGLPSASLLCSVEAWELVPAESTPTWVEFGFHRLFASADLGAAEPVELMAQPWLSADVDGDGVLTAGEAEGALAADLGLPGEGSLSQWLERRSRSMVLIEGGGACLWTAAEAQ